MANEFITRVYYVKDAKYKRTLNPEKRFFMDFVFETKTKVDKFFHVAMEKALDALKAHDADAHWIRCMNVCINGETTGNVEEIERQFAADWRIFQREIAERT